MRKVSEILGKNIISLYEGKRIGIIENVAFDKKLKKLKSFIVYDEDGGDIDRLFVPSGGVKIEGENAIMIKNLEKVVEDTKNLYSKKNPMNADVYNLKGTLLGKVNEVLIANDTNNIHSLLLNDGTEILQTQIVSGDFKTIVIQAPGEELPVLTSPKKKSTVVNEIEDKTQPENLKSMAEKSNAEIKRSVSPLLHNQRNYRQMPNASHLSSEDNSLVIEESSIKTKKVFATADTTENPPNVIQNESTLDSAGFDAIVSVGTPDTFSYNLIENVKDKIINSINSEKQKEIYPHHRNKNQQEFPINLHRLSAHFDFLIGRCVEFDVYNAKNEKIVAQNTIITNSVLDVCKKWGKLIVLARNSIR